MLGAGTLLVQHMVGHDQFAVWNQIEDQYIRSLEMRELAQILHGRIIEVEMSWQQPLRR